MPLEIKELHIKITVENNGGGGGSSGGSGGAGASSGSGGGNAAGEPDEATVAACVDKVLEVLKEKYER